MSIAHSSSYTRNIYLVHPREECPDQLSGCHTWHPEDKKDSVRVEGGYITSFCDESCSHGYLSTRDLIHFIHCEFFLRISIHYGFIPSTAYTPLQNKIRAIPLTLLSNALCNILYFFYQSIQNQRIVNQSVEHLLYPSQCHTMIVHTLQTGHTGTKAPRCPSGSA